MPFFMRMIDLRRINFAYSDPQGAAVPVFTDLDLFIPRGRYVAMMGPNGSGKTTLGKIIKGLLSPLCGEVLIDGRLMNTGEISLRVGYIFSNPENQIIASTVEEDIAFGLENMKMDTIRIAARVQESLRLVGMEKYRHQASHLLSGGQQQKIVLAGILAMDCDPLVLDEPTATLDPPDRAEILNLFRKIHEEGGKTLLHITHSLEEALGAQDLLLMEEGRVSFFGPWEDYLRREGNFDLSISIPPILQLIRELRQLGHAIPWNIQSREELKKFLLEKQRQTGFRMPSPD